MAEPSCEPRRVVPVQLEDNLDLANGVIDTKITFPDGSVAMAYSRLVALGDTSCAYSFLLTPPPVALERIEGALRDQAEILEEELQTLKAVLEA